MYGSSDQASKAQST